MRFELIKGTKTLKGTCYFEFVKHSDKKNTCWNENAFYLEDGVFIYFVNVFQNRAIDLITIVFVNLINPN